jgi:7 transmembrane sweet-taste receptor of 3 GCPR
LLLGLFSCAGLSALITAQPTALSCATIRFGTGVSFAIVFASLLVKCIFLISLNGGVYLPAPYQGLLLLFAVLIQITIGVQWIITVPPGVSFFREIQHTNRLIFTAENLNAMKENVQLCRTSFSEMRVSLIYIDFLIIIVTILAIKSRGIRDNYREATYIGLAVALVIPVWLGWTLVGLAVHEKHKDACLAFGLLATPSIVFLVMFMPKGRQLAAMGREDIYMDDREERFSASSRAGSGYSPSFFHFKPIKYGVMNGKSGGGTDGSSKHQQAVTTLGGGEFDFIFSERLRSTKSHFQIMHLSFHFLTTHRHCTITRTIIITI